MKHDKQNQIIFFFPDISIGGVEKNFFIISNYLAKFFDKLILITSSKPYNKLNKKIKIIEANNLLLSFNRRLYFIYCAIKLLLECIKYRKSIIISFQGNFYSLIIAIILKKKILIRSNLSPNAWTKNKLKKKIYKILLKRANIIVVNSEEFKKELKKIFKIESKVIYNPILLKNNKIKYPIKNIFFKKNKINLISVGRLVDQKNHIEILEAFNKLNNKISNFRLLIVGSGEKKNYLTNYIRNNSMNKIVKIISSKNAINFIKQSDVLILSSKYEGLPNVLLEAASLNKYIISSNCKTGPKEIIKSYKYGKLYKQGNVYELNSILNNLKKHKLKNNKINYSKNMYKFNHKANLEKYLDLIKKLN